MPAALKNKKQTTLNFGSSKPSPVATGKKPRLSGKGGKPVESSEIDEYSSPSDQSEEIEVEQVGSKRKRTDTRSRVNTNEKEEQTKTSTKERLELQKKAEQIKSPAKERPELKVNDSRWKKVATRARETNGNLQLIHAEKQNRIHDILRVFDLTYNYGPCIGISRIDRWERAQALGLNPPSEIRDILLTRQGIEDTTYAQNVFFDQAERV
ncbi:DNA polymerase delta, subunit 4-domain-containing protein [Rhodocollybia butyracea]|uniref:DNA polymerase delta, subunit 4-domain-containing protein n=1 Tax=Rhodocollybia butyracea TaxID=206335 RepID=A0A9P5UBH1_9AGAR|nr:DNA polymerase delta, subunit 4-domain-containing protein [Rhodocollybia butyracea]